jgi:hypothetical protein
MKGNLITDKSGEMKKSLLTSNKRGLDLRGLEKTVAISKDLDGLKLHLRGMKKTVEVSKDLDGLNNIPSRSEKDLKGYFKFL